MSRGISAWTAVAGLVLAIAAASAVAAEDPTRDEYRDQVEPICKTNTKANERILSGVRKQVQEGKLKAAGGKFTKAGAALSQARRQIVAVPQPSADRARLASWLDYIKTEAKLFGEAGRKLKNGDKRAASKIVTELSRTANQANAKVLPFDFVYCRLEPSRFT